MDMQKYVVGFLFDPTGEQVVLIRKNKPEWQKGCLNGVGGKWELGEGYYETMVREFLEETGLEITHWDLYGRMDSEGIWEAELFTTFSHDVKKVRSITDEKVGLYNVAEIVSGASEKMIGNVPWLVSLARDYLFNPRGPRYVEINY